MLIFQVKVSKLCDLLRPSCINNFTFLKKKKLFILGMGKELENLILENTELLATKWEHFSYIFVLLVW